MIDWIPILLIGLVGSVHCAGMCGGFVFALAQTSHQKRHFLMRQSIYYLGKTITYALMGAIAGAFGSMLGMFFSRFQLLLSVTLGLVLVLIGAGIMGVFRLSGSTFMLKPWKYLSNRMGRMLGESSRMAPLGLGLLNGLLPCGLVYAALAIAATSGSGIAGALSMSVFGLATIPALFVTATAGMLLKPAWRHRITIASGIIVIVLGLITINRGLGHDHSKHQTMPITAPHQEHLMHHQ